MESQYWQAVLDRNPQYDDKFVFAVQSTGIYCRPSCPARHPRQEHVQFFATPGAAQREGFRACKRCRPDQAASRDPRLEMVHQICEYLKQHVEQTPTLGELAEQFHLSAFYLQRTFKRLVGVTPRQYAAARRAELFRTELKRGKNVTTAIYDAGFQSSSSAYADSAETLGMTPGEYRRGGTRTQIRFATVPCALGWLLVAATERGICAVRLGDSPDHLEKGLLSEFPAATFNRSDVELRPSMEGLVAYLDGTKTHIDLPLDVHATAFQRRVWAALRAIPYGERRSYHDIARAIGQPRAVRAVATACARNPAALVIPCHRVIRKDGSLGGYRWGLERKKALLEQETQATRDENTE